MQFKNPEILYALFLLLIPIIVHLFQFRRFKKTPFTNVVFLKNLVQNTRKSSTLKKWIILCTRLLALAAIILAFAGPFWAEKEASKLPTETVIFLDNSFSMQAKGNRGPLLPAAIQDILQNYPPKSKFSLFTHNTTLKDITINQNQNDLLNIEYTGSPLQPKAIALQAKKLFSNNNSTRKELLVISDFQNIDDATELKLNNGNTNYVQLAPQSYSNFSIDSIQLTRSGNDYELEVFVYSNVLNSQSLPISLFNNNKLLTKGAVTFTNSKTAKTAFRLPLQESFAGKLSLIDAQLQFDNDFYFTINQSKPLRVLSINEADDNFLSRLFKNPEYVYTAVPANKLDYSLLFQQQVIVLNEVETISPALINALENFSNDGGIVILIPNSKINPATYSALLSAYGFNPFGPKNQDQKLITTINYDHPIYQGVFTERVTNLKYHTLSESFQFEANDVLLQLEDGNAFLAQSNGLFVFAGALNDTNSNFKNGQLIVPTFDKIALEALTVPKTYYILNTSTSFDIELDEPSESIVSLKKNEREFIPLQEQQGNKVTLFTHQALSDAGIYNVNYEDSTRMQVAYNYNRLEGKIQPSTANYGEGRLRNSLVDTLTAYNQANQLNLLYKWFIIFAVAMLILEMLILKFLK